MANMLVISYRTEILEEPETIMYLCITIFFRNSNLKVFCKTLAKFTGKHMYQSFFFSNLSGLSLHFYQKRYSDTGIFLWILQNV